MTYIQNRVGFAEDTRNFLSRKTGLLCAEASLPTSSMATAEVRDNFMGVPQEFAHTRLYTDIDFTFYVDSNYVNLRIFEAWMDYIAGGSQSEINELNENYYRRMNYPDNYKVQTMFISKFERDFNSQIDYQFVNAFPKLVTAIPVSYGAADLLKVTVSFTYDRYIVNPKGSIRKANSSGFSDIPRVANDATIRDQEIQALIDDYGLDENGAGLTREQAAAILSGGGRETVFEPEKTPPVERTPGSQRQETPRAPRLDPSQVNALTKALGGDPNAPVEFDTIRPADVNFGWNRHLNKDGTRDFRLFGVPVLRTGKKYRSD